MIVRVLWLLFKVGVVSLPLTWWWFEWGRRAYGRLFVEISTPIYALIGVTAYQGGVRERYINYIPFLVLMLVTPAIGWRRRLFGILVGAAVIFVFHLGFNLWAEVAFPLDGTRGGGFSFFLPAVLLSDALPFILWVLICHEVVGGIALRAFGRLGIDTPK
jgi:hypothetical protein